jgi:hypothetical protein
MQIKGEECPNTDEKFNAWKNNYMNSLKSWVNSLPDISKESCCAEERCETESTDDINKEIDTLYESVLGNLELDILDI